MKRKLAFVILHYNTLEDTIKCVKSIINYTVDSLIVIVDNGSSNNTGIKLQDKYKNIEYIHVVLSKKNLGFACGNNIGIDYIREKFTCEFIVCLNNDTVLLKNNFEEVISSEYEESKFAVLGPKVITKDGKMDSNPVRSRLLNKKQINILILKRLIKYIFCFLGVLNYEKRNKKIKKEHFDYDKRYENVQLHGCCLIFSSIYFEKFKGFDKDTFLYFEEDILFNRLINKKLKSIYDPSLEIVHNEDSATNSICPKNRSKGLFVYKNEIKSLFILKQKLKQSDRDTIE